MKERNTKNFLINSNRRAMGRLEWEGATKRSLYFTDKFINFKVMKMTEKEFGDFSFLFRQKNSIREYLLKLDQYFQTERIVKSQLMKQKHDIQDDILKLSSKNRKIEEFLKNTKEKYKQSLKISQSYNSSFLNAKFRLNESKRIYQKNMRRF